MNHPAGLRGLILTLLVTLAALSLYVAYPRFLEEIEDRTLDLRFWIRGSQDPGPEIVLVLIDEKGLAEFGRWPWSRSLQARLVERIKAGGARVIGLDLFYPEPENRQSDARMAEALRASRPVVLGLSLDIPIENSPERPARGGHAPRHPDFIDRSAFLRVRQASIEQSFRIKSADDGLPPVEPIGPAAEALGHVYALSEPDGTLRREILVLRYGDEFFPSLSLQTARLALGLAPDAMVLNVGRGIQLGGRFIPTDEYGRLLINYYGGEGTFPHFSAADVLAGRSPRDAFQNKIVLVGTSAVGTYDQKITPFSNNYPGVEKNATVLANILQENFLRHDGRHKAIDLATLLIVGLGLGHLLTRLRGLWGTVLAGGVLLALLIWLQGMFIWRGWWLNAVMPAGTVLFIYTVLTAEHYLIEERKAREVRAIFSRYVSPKIVEELVRRPESAGLGGRRQEVTVLFSDLKGFTAFSESHEPEAVVATLNEFLTAMTEVIFRWDGTLDKFVGDAIMVFWGAPLPQPDHAERAVRCALHMRREMERLREKWREEGRPVLDAGIGINTGAVLVGNMGAAGKKMDYTVIGDQVNLAARVEGLTRTHQAPVLITEETYRKIQPLIGGEKGPGRLGHTEFRKLPMIQVKGRAQAVTIYEVVSLPPGTLLHSLLDNPAVTR